MGMQTASIQRPMQQGSGKGGPLGQAGQAPTPEPQFDATSYLAQNPDVASSYSQNNYGMTPEQFAQTHFQKYGQAEGRIGGNQMSSTMPTYQSVPNQPSGGKGPSSVESFPDPQGMQGRSTNSATSGQPIMGAPNRYSNTVGQWDNTQIKPIAQGGKGKGA